MILLVGSMIEGNNEKIIQNISTYPHIIGKRNKSVPKKRLVIFYFLHKITDFR